MAEAKKSMRLKVKDIPEGVTEGKLKVVFENKKRQGGGRIEKIEYNEENHSAVITFEDSEAVDKIIERGTSVVIDGAKVKVCRLISKKKQPVNKPSTPSAANQRENSTPSPELEEGPPKKLNKAKSKSEAAAADGPAETTKPSVKKKDRSKSSRIDISRIVKLHVADVKKHLDTYIMYLQDDDELSEAFDESTMMLDGLKKQVFVTFYDAKDALIFRKTSHEEDDTNISRAEMATHEDLDYLSDRISVHLISDNPTKTASIDRSILKHLRKLTDLEIEDFYQYNETRSGLVKLAPGTTKDDIAALTWKFRTKVRDHELIPAPVRCDMCTLLVSDVDAAIIPASLKRYLQNSRSGGGIAVVTSLKEVSEGEYIAKMETNEMAEGIVEKSDHVLEGCKLKVEYFYPCLTKDTYNSWISSLGHSQVSSDSDSEDKSDTNDEVKTENSAHSFKDTLDIDRGRYRLMERAGLINLGDYKGLALSYDTDSGSVVLEGAKSEVLGAKHRLMRTEMNELYTYPLVNLEPTIVKLLQNKDQQDKLQKKLGKQNCLAEIQYEHDKVIVTCLKSSEKEKIVQTIRKHVVVEKRPVNPELVLMLESHQGKLFLKQLCEPNQENCHTSACVQLQADKKCLLLVAPAEQQYELNKKFDAFCKEYKVDEKKISFSKGQLKCMEMHLSAEKKDVFEKLRKEGLVVTETPDSIVLKGLEEKVDEGSKSVSDLREKIEEYLDTPEGKDKGSKTEEEDDNSRPCETDASKMPKQISCIKSDGCTLHVMKGDVTKLEVDALINPVDESRKCNTALGKAIVAIGGMRIEQELVGETDLVTMTSAGQLKTIKNIFHLVCPIFDDQISSEELKSAISICLVKIEDHGCRSVAIPLVFLGKKFKFPKMLGCKMLLEALKNHMDNADSLCDIYLCDMSDDNLGQLQECCENVFDGDEIERKSDVDETDTTPRTSPRASASRSQGHHSKPSSGSADKKFGNVKVSIVQGEVTKQKTDVIVITADKSLDLSKNKLGQAVLRYGGQSLQDELTNNYSSELRSGDFAITNGGDLRCKEIYYACLTSYKGSCSLITNVVSKQLEEAHHDHHRSIAFPALGVGGYKYPTDECAKAMLRAITGFSAKHPRTKLTTINLVIYSRGDFATFKGKLSSYDASDSSDDDSGITDGERRGGGGGGYNGRDEHKMTFGPVSLLVKQGNIIYERCEAIVVSVRDNNMDLSNSGYVCSAILQKCGDSLQNKCSAKALEIAQEGVTMTDVHNLKCKKIFYISAAQFGRSWDRGLAKVLVLADQEGIKSLGFPLLGPGGKQANLELIKTALKRFGQDNPKSLHDLRLVVHEMKQKDTFKYGHRARHEGNTSRPKYHGASSSYRGARRNDTATNAPSPSSELLEVVFSFDTTGSMYSYLEELRGRIKDMIQRLQADIPGIRMAVLAHGDYCDAANYITKHINFSTEVATLCDFVNDVPKTHGGDAPECYELAMREVRTKLSWTPGSRRVLVLIGDDVPHEPNESCNTDSIDWREEIKAFAEAGITIYGVQCGDRTNAESFYKAISQGTKGKYLKLNDFKNLFDMLMAVCYRESNDIGKLHNYEKEVRARCGGAALAGDIDTIFATLRDESDHNV